MFLWHKIRTPLSIFGYYIETSHCNISYISYDRRNRCKIRIQHYCVRRFLAEKTWRTKWQHWLPSLRVRHCGKSSITMTVSLWKIKYNHAAGSCGPSITAALCQKRILTSSWFKNLFLYKNTLEPFSSWNADHFLGLKEKHAAKRK